VRDRPDTAAPRRPWLALALTLAGAATFVWLVMQQQLWVAALSRLFPLDQPPVYQVPLAELVWQHVLIVAASSTITILIGLPLGIWVTRPSGRDFHDVVSAGVDFGQTFPPVAVLALAVPVLGFGWAPALLALTVYGLFPVVSGTVAGLGAVSPAVVDAATGLGIGRARILWTVEMPLSARVIMAGIRTSVIINVGTATVAAAVGYGGLGAPIIGGINVQNTAWIVEGALTAGLLAIVLDQLLARLEEFVTPQV
jgi:osmoprotectant transport system permease protein